MMHLRRFYIDRPAVVGSVAMIKDSDAHHIKTVLRLKKAALVYLLDAGGGLYEGAIKTIASEGVTVEVVEPAVERAASPHFANSQSRAKGARTAPTQGKIACREASDDRPGPRRPPKTIARS